MLTGIGETSEDKIDHILKIREVQDKTGGFTAFIAWTFQPKNTQLENALSGSHDYLKTLAISRLYLDNFDHIGASWLTQGPKVAQLALACGADDLGNTLIEENVIRSTGQAHRTTVAEMKRITEEAGLTLRQRDTFFNWLPPSPRPPTADSPLPKGEREITDGGCI